ncbi:SusC/RagA family TonB-linked outer membrane protein [Pedobacter frigidisoli]|uniref:SusC/RagA family TonB-linked outer membrane protein n=1 Tax=Pedobacter frigidisoli TaxID=2530455 RepID=UPI00292DE37C|nr:SusC/RagA family TonB-linked outer membrane protein [Pedobacter frigidisoli]
MNKNYTEHFYRPPGYIYKLFFTFKIIAIILLISLMQVSAASFGQQVSIKGKNVSVEKVLWEIRKQTGYDVIVATSHFNMTKLLNVNFSSAPLKQVLDNIVSGTPYNYSVSDKSITIRETNHQVDLPLEKVSFLTIAGRVVDENGTPLSSAGVSVKGTKIATSTQRDGKFSISASLADSIIFTFVGYQTRTILASAVNGKDVKLIQAAKNMNEVVINTGIYQRKAESFTGSSATFSVSELKAVGNQNILQSLKTLDPSFALRENNITGSNPNQLANVEIRGKTSVVGLTQEFQTDPNQPLFILDGFESNLQVISDLSMDRVENITILKDAAATAIYGSKAANGVIVVETKKPKTGKLRMSYSGNYSVDFADLSDYNLMNAEQKLEFERLSLLYGPLDQNGRITNEGNAAVYNQRLADAKRGVNTNWMNQAIRVVGTSRHTLFAEGGDSTIRYGAGFSYGNTKGVMKGSDRNVINGNLRLIYRKNNFQLSEFLNVDYLKTNQETVPFSSFSRANPYYRIYNEQGELNRVLEQYSISTVQNGYVFNPVYDMLQNNLNTASRLSIRNNIEIEWSILRELRARGRFSLSKGIGNTEIFKSPYLSDFFLLENLRKGAYTQRESKSLDYDTDFSLVYGKLLGKNHLFNAVLGVRGASNEASNNAYDAEGFADDIHRTPGFANSFSTTLSKPVYAESLKRSLSSYFNMGYAFDSRYLIDASFRSDGSSVFGSANRFTNTWSVGLAWNVHKEHFFNVDWISQLRLRSSIGNPGNQNFDAYIAIKTYAYNNAQSNPYGLSAVINAYGNPDLAWQKTIDKNIGFDLEILNRRFRLTVDYYNKDTDPLLVYTSIASSSGTSSLATNLGGQLTEGITASLNATLVRSQNFFWSINANMRHQKSKFYNIGNALSNLNIANRGINTNRYYDGGSPTSLWTVVSAGIDPASGQEVFIKKDGTQTFVYDYADEVNVGDAEPKLEGIIGTSFNYKGFTLNVNIRYRTGGQIFQNTLFNKVENINSTQIHYNQDARALTERWKSPGDLVGFKSIAITTNNMISSRFVADEHTISGESISFGYNGQPRWLKKAGASALNARMYMADIFRISNVVNERGLDYPFARSISLSLGLTF